MNFNTTWDNSVLLWTILISLLLIFTIAMSVKRTRSCIKDKSYWSVAFYVSIIILIISIITIQSLQTPLGVRLTNNQLQISRLITPLSFDYDSIKIIRRVIPNDLVGETRVMGSTGFLGDLGNYKSTSLGSYEKCSTNKDNQILLETFGEDKYIFSSDNPDELVNEVIQKIK